MRVCRFACSSLVVVLLCCSPSRALAQTPDVETVRQEIDQLRKELADIQKRYDDRIAALEARLGAPPAVPGAPPGPDQTPVPAAEVPPGAAGAGGPTGSLPIYGAASAASKIFNPDIAVIGDFLGAAGHNEVNPVASARDARIGGVVPGDRRSVRRARISSSRSVEEGVELEEGFITFPTAPRRACW